MVSAEALLGYRSIQSPQRRLLRAQLTMRDRSGPEPHQCSILTRCTHHGHTQHHTPTHTHTHTQTNTHHISLALSHLPHSTLSLSPLSLLPPSLTSLPP